MEEGLVKRGFAVVRLNTYATAPVDSVSPADVASAASADVVTFGSPSAVKAWMKLVAPAAEKAASAAAQGKGRRPQRVSCIGIVSAEASRKAGVPEDRLFYAKEPGIAGWVEETLEALD